MDNQRRDELVLSNLRYVHYWIQKLNIKSKDDYDDLVSIGTIGLIKAANSFDESKKIRFSTYSATCICNELLMYYRRTKKYLYDISLDDILNVDYDGNELTYADLISTGNDFTVDMCNSEYLSNFINIILNYLNCKDRLLMLYHVAGISQTEISRILNISQSYVSGLEKKLSKKVKYILNQEKKENFKEVFSMSIQEDLYQISFSTKDVRNFNLIFSDYLKTATTSSNSSAMLNNFKISSTKERIVICLPSDSNSFYFIAELIKQIDNYVLNYKDAKEPDLQTSSSDTSSNVKANISEEKITNKSVDDTVAISQIVESAIDESVGRTHERKNVSRTKQIKAYILSCTEFTSKQIKNHFSEEKTSLISVVLCDLKKNGIIESIGNGRYKLSKT